MDAQAKKKALFRAKLNAQKTHKRIDSPIVRYNESDQPVCRVCNVVLKSESNWDAHQVSRKHREAINNMRASAADLRGSNDSSKKSASMEFQQKETEPSSKLLKPQPPSRPPPKFLDNHETSRERIDKKTKVDGLGGDGNAISMERDRSSTQDAGYSKIKQAKGSLPDDFFDKEDIGLPSMVPGKEHRQISLQADDSKVTRVKGSLPEGFFDNKEADLLARGIKLVKPDIKDEYKEFEKLIQEDLQVMDSRMEEEEVDAAEMIEEEEHLEQRSYKEKVEMLKRKKMELRAAREAKRSKGHKKTSKKAPEFDESSSDGDDDDGGDDKFTVDWRAQHL